eukprot:3811041-Amphidinium_carterae.6
MSTSGGWLMLPTVMVHSFTLTSLGPLEFPKMDWQWHWAARMEGNSFPPSGVLRISFASREPPEVRTILLEDHWHALGLLPRLVTWNTAGLFSRNGHIYRSRLGVVQQPRQHADTGVASIACTRRAAAQEASVSTYAGLGLLAKLEPIDIIIEEVCSGRAASITSLGPHPLCLVVIHLLRNHLHIWRQLAEVTHTWCSLCLYPMLLLGGMNVVYAEHDAVDGCGSPKPTPYTVDGNWWQRQWMTFGARPSKQGLPRYITKHLQFKDLLHPIVFSAMLNRCEGWSHVAAMTDASALRWLRDDCKAARAEMLQEEASAEVPDGQTQKIRLPSQDVRHQWSGQLGISCCSTISDERNAMAHYCAPVFQAVPPVGMKEPGSITLNMPRSWLPIIHLEEPLMQSVIQASSVSAPGPVGVMYAMVVASGM